jgi:phosphoglycerate dehydrogenase-like enzyme
MTTPAPDRLRVVVADANLLPHREAFEAGVPAGTEVVWHDRLDEDAVVGDLPGAHVFVGARFTAAMGEASDALRLVHVAGAGVDGIDMAALPEGAQCANTFHHEDSIAEYIAATSVVVRRGLLVQDRALRDGHWASPVFEPDRPQAGAMRGATVGIVGYGHIGARAWANLRAMGARGVVVTRRPPDAAAEGLDWARGPEALPDLLAEADVVVLCLPLTEETRHLIGADQLAVMRPDAVLVNVSRGPLVDPEALHAALVEERLGGAVLDVWYSYPSEGSTAQPAPVPFGELGNVLMTPHVSGVTRQTFAGRVADITANIRRLRADQPLENRVVTTR